MTSQCKVPPVKEAGLTYVPDEVILYGMDLITRFAENSRVGFGRIRPDATMAGEDWDIYMLAGRQLEENGAGKGKKSQGNGSKDVISYDELLGAIKAATSRDFAAVYGYAYEGSCYRLDKPKILVFKSKQGSESAVGCGFDEANLNYRMWRVRTSDTLVEMTISSDTFQKLILEQNLPGRRAPNTYAANMIQGGGVSHRGGRLVDG